MISKMKKILLFALLIILLAVSTFFIIKNIVIAADENEIRATTDIGKIVLGDDPDTYGYPTYTGAFDGVTRQNMAGDVYITTYEGYEIYCIEPGAGLSHFDYDVLYSEVLSEANGLATHNQNGNHTLAGTGTHRGDRTSMYLIPGDAVVMTPAVAYIVSDTINTWTVEKQRALWNLRDKTVWNGREYVSADGDIIEGSGMSEVDEPTRFDTEAIDYATYDYSIRDENGKNIGLQPENATNVDEIEVEEDRNNSSYTIGPFNVTYTNGIYGDVAFAGISGITLVGYNSQGEFVREMDVTQFMLQDQTTGLYGDVVNASYFSSREPDSVLADDSPQIYPASGQNFKIVFDDPNEGVTDRSQKIATVSVKVKFQYMIANGQYRRLENVGKCIVVGYQERHYTCTEHENCEICIMEPQFQRTGGIAEYQDLAVVDALRTIYEQEIILATDVEIDTDINIGGHVWEDGVSGKESRADGLSNTGSVDISLKNIKVTLYTSDGQIATLNSDPNEAGISEEEIMHRINPTYTDENGNYLFTGVDPDQQYYVVFEYNGQRYLTTEYLNTSNGQYNSAQKMVSSGQYGTDSWRYTSKGTESTSSTFAGVEISRNALDTRFQEIGSYPNNYNSSNSLGVVGSYNATYTQLDLMGYTLNENGTYTQTGVQLVDGYLYNQYGLETDTYQEGVISSRVREYIRNNKRFPDDNAMRTIYQGIAGNDTELWRKLQFIEDSYIQAYSGSPFTGSTEYYLIGDDYYTTDETYGDGEYYINLGLWRRQEFDAALTKDVYKATLKINNKTVVYNYDERNVNGGTNSADGNDNNTYWDINVRMSDYNNYYGRTYTRGLYETDYLFNTVGNEVEGHSGEPLEMYITYKITIRNQSQSIMGEIEEVVDYYDSEYTYREDLSWVTYDSNTVTDEQYYNAMVAENLSSITNAKAINSSNSSKYGSSTQSDMGSSYNAVYIRGLDGKKLATGESAYIYLTFQVNKDSNGRVILDDESNAAKENLAEINGYTTYYRDGTTLPNNVTKSSSNIAGLLDRDSNPGNLVASDLSGSNYERNFEDDTDRAPSLRVVIDDDAVRQANGVVWEDERNTTVGSTDNSSDAIIGDGTRQDDETGIQGVTVQLVEKCTDGTEHIWQETSTNEDGVYSFESYIPGNYIIRFYYGDTNATALTTSNGGLNVVSYNGQDFKSTTYQVGISSDYDVNDDNESGTYTYNISAADSAGVNYSDAKDIWSRREAVNNYSTNNITNHIAEVLASPYSGDSSLYEELINNTYMTAETGVIVAEFEYNQQIANSSSTDNGYVFNNVDFGLVERPKAQLEIDKSVANVRVTLANGTILFDINGPANNALWQDHEEYNLDEEKVNSQNRGIDFENGEIGMYEEYYGNNRLHRYSFVTQENIVTGADKGLIQLTMDQELMHGATIQITYAVKITNVGEVDYDSRNFYYKGVAEGNIVTTTANQVVDYVANNLQYDSTNTTNDGWEITTGTELVDNGLVNSRLENTSTTETNDNKLSQFNTIIKTDDFATALVPGQEVSKTLVLSQLITAQNSNDDLTYENITEIIETSNTAGRRMAYSVVGNQDPTTDPAEVDSSAAERIVILPPFGIGETLTYLAIALAVGAILVVGIVLIRRKVLKGKNS